jgi:cell division protein FtsB
VRITFRTDTQALPGKGRPAYESRAFRIALFLVIGCSFLSVLGSFLGDGGLMFIYQQSQNKRDLRAKIVAEEAHRQQLLARVEALKHDPFELERVAREELGMTREREIVYDFREQVLR